MEKIDELRPKPKEFLEPKEKLIYLFIHDIICTYTRSCRKTRSSAIAEGSRDAPRHLKSCQLLQRCNKNHIIKACSTVGGRPWRLLKVIGYSMSHASLPINDVCSNNDFILHRFWDITTFTLYLTARDVAKSFVFETKLKLQAKATCTYRFMCKHIVDNTYYISPEVWELERFQTANVTFKVIQEHWQLL